MPIIARGRWTALLVALCWAAGPGLPCRAQPGTDASTGAAARARHDAHKQADLQVEIERLRTRKAYLEQEIEKLKKPRDRTLPSTIAEGARKWCEDYLHKHTGTFQANLKQADEELGRQLEGPDGLAPQWRAAHGELWEHKAELFDVQAQEHLLGQAAYVFSADNRWFWLGSVLALAAPVALLWHQRRHEYRRMMNGGAARALGLARGLTYCLVALILMTAAVFLCGDWIYERFLRLASGQQASPADELRQAIDQATAERGKLEQDCDRLRKEVEDKTPESGKKVQELLGALQEKVHLKEFLARQLQTDQSELATLTNELGQHRNQAEAHQRRRQWFQVGQGAVLLTLLAAVVAWLGYVAYRRRQERSNTCPMCLQSGKLQSLPPRANVAHAPPMVACGQPGCDFAYLEMYRDRTKLCFPTLGHPQAGKTHWLAMVYDQLTKGGYPKGIQIEKVQSPMSEQFDRLVKQILSARLGPKPTEAGQHLRHPLLFDFTDHDALGKSNVMLSVFDYPGELTASPRYGLLHSPLRLRALQADGYLFFLDPLIPSDVQKNSLERFRDDLRALRRMPLGRSLRTPVALVVSKIDLMADAPYAQGLAHSPVTVFYEELFKIDPTGMDFSLEAIQKRSDLVARLRDTIWPGWHIEQLISDLFGGRVLFFPLTPVGLQDVPQGTDLTNRQFGSFGILQPLAWLIHMNGYPVLT
jgi:hypothetical protein